MEDRAAVRQRCAQDPELRECGMHLMYCIYSLPISILFALFLVADTMAFTQKMRNKILYPTPLSPLQ